MAEFKKKGTKQQNKIEYNVTYLDLILCGDLNGVSCHNVSLVLVWCDEVDDAGARDDPPDLEKDPDGDSKDRREKTGTLDWNKTKD